MLLFTIFMSGLAHTNLRFGTGFSLYEEYNYYSIIIINRIW